MKVRRTGPQTVSADRGRIAAKWNSAHHLVAHRAGSVLRYYIKDEAAPFTLREILRDSWFDRLLDGVVTGPPDNIRDHLRLLASPDMDRGFRIDGQSAVELAGCLLHSLGAHLDGVPFPPIADPVAALRLLRSIPNTPNERRELALRILEACENFLETSQS